MINESGKTRNGTTPLERPRLVRDKHSADEPDNVIWSLNHNLYNHHL